MKPDLEPVLAVQIKVVGCLVPKLAIATPNDVDAAPENNRPTVSLHKAHLFVLLHCAQLGVDEVHHCAPLVPIMSA